MELSGAEIIVQALIDEGVEYVFGYPGGAVLHTYDALFKQDKVKHILVRHEQAATHGADGYARATGRCGVALVTSDAHAGLVGAIGATLPGASWQRCRTHYTANLMSVCPKHAWPAVKAWLHSVFEQADPDAVHAQYDRLLAVVETN